jgi:hypothetical protein
VRTSLKVSALAAGLLLASFVAGSVPVQAEIGPGEQAPDFVGKDFFNTEPTTLHEQRGRLVFLELFSTT